LIIPIGVFLYRVMKKRVYLSPLILSGLIFLITHGCRKDENTITPYVTTGELRDIRQTTASCGGEILSDRGTTVSARGVCWSLAVNPSLEDNKTVNGTGTGSFTSTISGLNPNSKYYVRAYATNNAGTGYGKTISFITLTGQVPEIITTAISNITQTSATCGGEIKSDGGLSITLRGVCYSTSPNPTLSGNFTTNGTGTGTFISNLTGLSFGKTYYARAFASNSLGTTYGNEYNFTTIVLPIVSTTTFFDVKGISAKAGGVINNNGGDIKISGGLCWSTAAEPTTLNNHNTSFTSEITGLSTNTVYYVRAYATNFAGTSYGNQVSFNSGYIIGSNHSGGLVFYNDGNGHGLVCAATDQSEGATWGCNGTVLGAFSTAVNTGSSNTSIIVNACPDELTAAKICDLWNLNKYSDWYLPSIDELNLMYVNLHMKESGDFTSYYYWSSSEFGNVDAWLMDFNNGIIYYSLKISVFRVRTIRTF
jgi:hypothetical protein